MTLTVFVLLALFGIKHFVADFVLQFSYMVRDKGTYGALGGFHHAGIHAVLTLLICLWFSKNWHDAVTLSALDCLIHYHVDYIKQQLTRYLTPKDRMFWLWLGADQCLHYLTYVLIIACLMV